MKRLDTEIPKISHTLDMIPQLKVKRMRIEVVCNLKFELGVRAVRRDIK